MVKVNILNANFYLNIICLCRTCNKGFKYYI